MTNETQILPGKYTKKPVTIDAFCLGVDYIPEWFMDKVTSNEITLRGAYSDLQSCEINTLEGVMVGKKGDWIIKGVKGEIYPCKPDIFASTYDIASTPAIADGADPDMPAAQIRLHFGELTNNEIRLVRAAIRFANSQRADGVGVDTLALSRFYIDMEPKYTPCTLAYFKVCLAELAAFFENNGYEIIRTPPQAATDEG